MTKHSNIVLKWGLTDDAELYKWHRDAVQGKRAAQERLDRAARPARAGEGALELLRTRGRRKWDGPDFNAEGNDVAIETLELAHEGVERA